MCIPLSIHFSGLERVVRVLIEKGLDVNAVDENNESALFVAAARSIYKIFYRIFMQNIINI